MLSFRFANKNDADLFFRWSSDRVTRENSYNTADIEYHDHVDWFYKRINNPDILMYVFMNEDKVEVGQVRIESSGIGESKISISVDAEMRGLGHGAEMIKIATKDYLGKNPGKNILAFIFKNNEASKRSFIKAGFKYLKEVSIKNIPSFVFKIES